VVRLERFVRAGSCHLVLPTQTHYKEIRALSVLVSYADAELFTINVPDYGAEEATERQRHIFVVAVDLSCWTILTLERFDGGNTGIVELVSQPVLKTVVVSLQVVCELANA
jgi:hypothetical protein